jgi:NAD(P)-dependent dehydrogenase (short-subunit alcohol dehydrogenase family)
MDNILDRFRLTGKVAAVTGSGSGIGRAISLAFAQAGAAVAGLEIAHENGQQTAEQVSALGREAHAYRCDVSNSDQVRETFEDIDRRFGRLDILVNCAYAGSHTKPHELELEQWRQVLDVGVTGYFMCAQAAGRRMIERGTGGSIVNLSSIAGTSALGRGNFVYSVGKGAINQMTRELAIEWAPYGIRVNAIQPAQVRTPALQSLIDDPKFDSDTLVATFLRGIPMDRLVEPEEVAAAALFLASDAASMITGILLPVDGGNLAMNAGGTVKW